MSEPDDPNCSRLTTRTKNDSVEIASVKRSEGAVKYQLEVAGQNPIPSKTVEFSVKDLQPGKTYNFTFHAIGPDNETSIHGCTFSVITSKSSLA